MKNLRTFVCVLFVSIMASATASAALIHDARVNEATNMIEIDVSYGGGCEVHEFELKMSGVCLESFPVQCSAELVHNSNGDMCEAYIHETVEFSMSDYSLNDPYFSGASLSIKGSGDSGVVVRLPWVE